MFPRRECLNDAGLLLISAFFFFFQPQLTYIDYPSKKRFQISEASLLLITGDSPAPGDQKPQIPDSKYHTNVPSGDFEGLSNILLKLH